MGGVWWRLISSESARSRSERSMTVSPLPPWEALLTCPPRLARLCNGWRLVASWWRQQVRARLLNFPRPVPIAPMGSSLVHSPLQGGGVMVNGGTVTFQSCDIHDNQAPLQGSGVYITAGDVSFSNCKIYSNIVRVSVRLLNFS